MTAPIRVLLVDDHLVARLGLRLMLAHSEDIEVRAEAASAAAALALLGEQEFDVVLLDIGLPDKNGLDVLKIMREAKPAVAVLIISMHTEEAYALRALRLGAAGYLTKESSIENLVEAVRLAAAGRKYVPPALLQKLACLAGGEAWASHERLTDRELEIFRLIAAGQSLVAIAARLHLSPSTVTTYRARILEKLGLKTNAELTRYAIDHNLLD